MPLSDVTARQIGIVDGRLAADEQEINAALENLARLVETSEQQFQPHFPDRTFDQNDVGLIRRQIRKAHDRVAEAAAADDDATALALLVSARKFVDAANALIAQEQAQLDDARIHALHMLGDEQARARLFKAITDVSTAVVEVSRTVLGVSEKVRHVITTISDALAGDDTDEQGDGGASGPSGA